ncbi:MAG: hypothetical protein IPJ79_04775 [Bacteroidetes bacterium]|nr:hypothetical protein [Bacteroidota bacterium]
MSELVLFEEKQYLGFNKYSILRRMILAIFCFVAYYYTEDREQNADLLFLLGVVVLVVSIITLFVLHLKTTVYPGRIELDGLWSTKKVKIDLQNIVKFEKSEYSKHMLNNPVYNLHIKGTIRFYTSGNDALLLTDKEGVAYKIGTQKKEEFFNALKKLQGLN